MTTAYCETRNVYEMKNHLIQPHLMERIKVTTGRIPHDFDSCYRARRATAASYRGWGATATSGSMSTSRRPSQGGNSIDILGQFWGNFLSWQYTHSSSWYLCPLQESLFGHFWVIYMGHLGGIFKVHWIATQTGLPSSSPPTESSSALGTGWGFCRRSTSRRRYTKREVGKDI